MFVRKPNSGGKRPGLSGTVLLLALVSLLALGGGFFWMFNRGPDKVLIDPITAEVTIGDFVSAVLDQGEVQSSENVEIRCQVQARNGQVNVLEVVPEGTRVKPGDFLVRLDATSFEKELEQQKVSVTNAQTAVIQSNAAFLAAEASKNEYEQGLFVQSEKTIQNEIFDAEAARESALQELKQSEAVLAHTERLFKKGFQTKQVLEADTFAVKRAQTNLEKAINSIELAQRKLQVLQEITKEKELVRLRSDIEAAKVKLDNDKEALTVEENKLAEINRQIRNCTVLVPPNVEGQVVYAKESSRGGTEWVLEEGAAVRENQVLLRLPNPAKMEVKALINEQSITLIRNGMPATIRVDALNSQTLKGVVTKVNQYAESSGWMSTTIRKYAVLVRILNPPAELKPGMNASVSVQTLYQKDAIQVPLQCVYGVQDRQFCLVKTGDPDNMWETREIKIGGDNSKMVWVKEGLEVGEKLVMNPGAYKELMDLPEVMADEKIELPPEVQKEIEESRARSGGSATAQAGGTPAPDGPSNGKSGEGANRGKNLSPAERMKQMIERLDQNGDGKIQTSEWNSSDNRLASFVDNPDADNDGVVTTEELTKTFEAMRARMQQNGGGGGGFGGPGGGTP